MPLGHGWKDTRDAVPPRGTKTAALALLWARLGRSALLAVVECSAEAVPPGVKVGVSGRRLAMVRSAALAAEPSPAAAPLPPLALPLEAPLPWKKRHPLS